MFAKRLSSLCNLPHKTLLIWHYQTSGEWVTGTSSFLLLCVLLCVFPLSVCSTSLSPGQTPWLCSLAGGKWMPIQIIPLSKSLGPILKAVRTWGSPGKTPGCAVVDFFVLGSSSWAAIASSPVAQGLCPRSRSILMGSSHHHTPR